MVRRESANVAPGSTMRGRVMPDERSECRANCQLRDFRPLAASRWRFQPRPPTAVVLRNHNAIAPCLPRFRQRRADLLPTSGGSLFRPLAASRWRFQPRPPTAVVLRNHNAIAPCLPRFRQRRADLFLGGSRADLLGGSLRRSAPTWIRSPKLPTSPFWIRSRAMPLASF